MNERRSWEFSAIPLTIVLLGILGLLMWAFTAGTWVWVAIGVVALVASVIVALVLIARPRRAAPDRPALPDGAATHIDDGMRRILLIADDDCAPDDLGGAIADMSPRGVEAFVVAPALGSRTARWTGDERAYEDAAKHLEATLAALAALNVDARGHVGSHDPLQAIDDGLREYPADEILIAVHGRDQSNWLEKGIVDDARVRYPLPVRAVTVPRA